MKTTMFWKSRQIDVTVYGFVTIPPPEGGWCGPQHVFAVSYDLAQDGNMRMRLVPAEDLRPIDN